MSPRPRDGLQEPFGVAVAAGRIQPCPTGRTMLSIQQEEIT